MNGAPVEAYELYNQNGSKLDADLEAVFGAMHSKKNYSLLGTQSAGSSSWREGYVKYGLRGSQGLDNKGTVYGAFSMVSSGTWGDGDAGGFTEGTERRTAVEDAYLGWRSDTLFPTLGENGIDISFGSQKVVVGDGFLINGDAVSLGDVDLGQDFNRGGAFYIAPRKAFDHTAVLRLGGDKGWRGDLMWLRSDNPAQAETELSVATLEHIAEPGTLGLTYIRTSDINEHFATPAQLTREGMETMSLRGRGSLGVKNLDLSFEYATQDQEKKRENAWYLEGSWNFADAIWNPTVTYRFSRFSEKFDPLFYGMSRGYGTWYQGEVASNFAGPLNSNTRVHHVGLKANPLEALTIGALYFDFNSIDKNLGNFDGRELDFYAEWRVNEHVSISPVVGLFKPERASSDGGSQLGGNGTNVYTQLIVATVF
ncbi:alginate export family protein [Pseudomonas sp. MAFF 302030]|uniref:Alginate export family protein n=1 Tax=Pseudomonas morbosilactucae TaxID=2938197 RepID=A0A9X1Z079_9PSED|nr:hypothetical protein [Pseudomonas morbosilactucae]MCK9801390.1 alginate export family protein [Pseudomonas morbosilactucae]